MLAAGRPAWLGYYIDCPVCIILTHSSTEL